MRSNKHLTRVLWEFMRIVHDLLLIDNPQHKGPKSQSRLFAYGYQSFRLRAVEIISRVARARTRRVNPGHETLLFNGMFECRLQISDAMRQAVSETTRLRNPDTAGARRKAVSDWSLPGSKFEYRADYWPGSPELRDLTIAALEEAFGTKRLYSSLSALAGYDVTNSDLFVGVGVTRGENSNSQWHLDSFHPVIKGFIALNDIAEDDAKFQYVVGSFNERRLVRDIHKTWILSGQYHRWVSSPRLSPTQVLYIRKHQTFSMTGPAGTAVFANTSGVHRKGPDQSGRERWQIDLEVRRRGPFSNLLSLVS